MTVVKGEALAAAARREYMRAWRAKNREKVKAANERYWAKKGEALLQQQTQQPREAVT